jgi:hypothetical protein
MSSNEIDIIQITNNSETTVYLNNYHIGGGKLPWLNGLPRCETITVLPGETQSWKPSKWYDWSEYLIFALVDVLLITAEVALVVVTEGAAAPAEAEATVEIMGEEGADIAAEGGAESIESASTQIAENSQTVFQNAATKLGISTNALAKIIEGTGIATGAAILALEGGVGVKYNGWEWYLTNGTDTIYTPNIEIRCAQDNSIRFIVDDEYTTWDSQDPSSITSSNGKLDRLPGYGK